MAKDETFKGEHFASFFKEKRRKQALRETQADEGGEGAVPSGPVTSARVDMDARISTTVNAQGRVQLNVRVPADVKARVLLERTRRRNEGHVRADVHDIVTDAVCAYLPKD